LSQWQRSAARANEGCSGWYVERAPQNPQLPPGALRLYSGMTVRYTARMGLAAFSALFRRDEVRTARNAVIFLGACAALWLTSIFGYLLFHSIVEMTGVAIATAVFMISWSSRGHAETQPFVLLGIGYLFVAILDLLHTLSYTGMNVIPPGVDYATKLWVVARGLQALVTLAFVLLARARRPASSPLAFVLVGGVSILAVLSIFLWNIFPLCFVEGQGVTLFKKLSEYAISAVLVASIALLAVRRGAISTFERRLLIAAFAMNVASELIFTLYVSAYGYQNLLGHLLKFGSFVLAYQALFSSKIRSRLALIEELKLSTARLEESEAELRSAALSKDKFISILAHDLRNPMGGILSLSELLATKFGSFDPQRIRQMCALIYDGAKESSELLESLLQWTRAQAGRLAVFPSAIPVAELCDGIVSLQRPVAGAKGVTLDVRVSPEARAWADENMAATVIRNLISNAVKFTPQGGQVSVASMTEGDWERITVKDTGCGMTPEELGKLFRIDVHFSTPGTNGEHGAGMGLILCSELVALNRGTIEAHSQPGRGSAFTFSLPRPDSDGKRPDPALS
jgi:signal transduction histidine kinase